VLTHIEEHFCVTKEKKMQIESKYKEFGLEIACDRQKIEI
jgi:hypothetical protein